MSPEPRFLRRFEQIRISLRRYQTRLGLASTVLAAAVGLGLLAWADHRLELTRAARAVGLASVTLATLAVLVRWVVAPLRWWTMPRTASEIESRFPQLGQRIRTVVQFAGRSAERIDHEGVRPSLVEALEAETEERATPLPLDHVVRWRRAHALSSLAAVPVALLAFAAMFGPEWRIAIQRAFLIERPYTTIDVKPGDLLVDQGSNVPLVVEVKGRPRKLVALQIRPVGKSDAPWKSEKLPDTANRASHREVTIEKVKDPIEYRVVAGPALSPSFAIRVRYPLAIKAFEVKVTPPTYTGLDPKTSKGGDVQAVEGSVATFRIAFDAFPTQAALEMVDPSKKTPKKGDPSPSPAILPLKREGEVLVATLDLVRDLDYQVVARTVDGRVLAKHKYRIDVREDRAPRVVFDEPDEALEVHPIAEVRHRVRVDDDFGLTRAGIVYRFNDGDEKTLIAQQFPIVAGKRPKTSATLEELLLIETLGATPQDSITYYGFAEDNFPDGPRRTETDLRYIDLRVFRREYKLAEPGSGDGDPMELTSLDELIARQRINLNRANRLARHKPTDRTEADDPLKIAGFEESLLNLTREFTEGIERLADARVDSLHKALDAMQASVDALDRSKVVEAPPAMAEALKHLVAARRDLVFLIASNPALAAQMRSFDRKQAQKIRKPKSKDQEAEEVAARLEELAQEEDLVYATIATSMGGTTAAEAKDRQKSEPSTPNEEENPGQSKEGQQGEGDAGKPKLDRRAVAEKQEQIADEVRDLEGKLKRLEAASDLAKARMAKTTEKVEKASGALARGNSREAADDAKAGAGMLHELARQVKGEIAREDADELAMARDLAEELARREAEMADSKSGQSPSASPGDQPGKGEKGRGTGATPGQGGPGGWNSLTEDERIDRMAEMARTLEAWLKQIDKRGEGKAADAIGEILDKGSVAEIVERAGRMRTFHAGGKADEIGPEARGLATRLEVIGQALDLLHRGIVAPQLAALVEFDRRVADLTARIGDLKSEAEVVAWRREVVALIRDLEKAGIEGAAELAGALRAGGGWDWDADHRYRVAPGQVLVSLQAVSVQIKDRVQELILKDLASSRDEATPPSYRELVDRYYEVISKGGQPR